MLLKNPDELLKTVTHNLAGFQDGAGKTAVAMELMGRNAAQLIPLINQMGGNFDKMTEEAKKFGIVLSEED